MIMKNMNIRNEDDNMEKFSQGLTDKELIDELTSRHIKDKEALKRLDTWIYGERLLDVSMEKSEKNHENTGDNNAN